MSELDDKAGAGSTEPAPPPLVFVVDDSTELGEMLEVMLARSGYETRVFSHPLRALEALETVNPKPRLLVSDFRMPDMNGLELTQRCKLIHPTLKVIAASANIAEEDLARYPFRPDRILLKPYSINALLSAVKLLLPPG
jgi:CheY-like chemotaxis protein